MSMFTLAAELGKEIRADERMQKMEEAKKAYEGDIQIINLLTEYRTQQEALTSMGDDSIIDEDTVTRIQDRIDEIYNLITTNPLFIELDKAQAQVNELMQTINNTIMYNATGETSCTHDCSSCGGCH